MDISLKDLTNKTCSNCFKFLSVTPIKSYSSGQIQCGRCSKKTIGGEVLNLPIEANRIRFPCNNRFEGCTARLTYKETENHEKTCPSFMYDCPMCDCSGPSYLILTHFQLEHPENVLYYGSTIPVNLNNHRDDGAFLYVDHSLNILAFAKYTSDWIRKDFQVFTFDAQVFGLTKRGTQRVELYTVSNKLKWASETKVCEPFDDDKIIEADLNPEDYLNNTMLCKVFIEDDGVVPTHDDLETKRLTITNPQKQSPNCLSNLDKFLDQLNTDPFSDLFDLPNNSPSPLRANRDEESIQPSSSAHRCDLCGMVCRSGAGLASHRRAHNKPPKSVTVKPNQKDISKLKCTICDKVCQSGAGLASHIRGHDGNAACRSTSTAVSPTGGVANYSCSECGRACGSGAGLASHMRAHERERNASSKSSSRSNVSSNLSSKSSIISSGAGESIANARGSSISIGGGESYSCSECGRACGSGAGLASHMRAHERERNASSKSSSRSNVSSNLSSKSSIISSGAGESIANARGSSISIGGGESYSCSECGRACGSGAGLASHMRAHERERNASPVVSSSRSSSISSSGSIARSSIISSVGGIAIAPSGGSKSIGGGATYSCSECGTVCGSGAGLASHIRAHERQRNALFLGAAASFPMIGIMGMGSSSGRSSSSGGGGYFSSGGGGYFSNGGGGGGGGHSCSDCGRVCGSGAGLASHMRAHARRS